MHAIFTIARFTLLEAWRTRLIGLFILSLLVAMGIAQFMGGLAITESTAIKTSLLAGMLRIVSVFILCLYIATSMVREINDKGIELTLSLPVSRASYYLGKLLGFTAIALLMTLLISLCLFYYVSLSAVLIWSASLFCELLIMASLSLLCVYTFNQVITAITCVAAFYLLARSIDAIQLMSHGPLTDPGSPLQVFMTHSVDALAHLMPDLYRFCSTEWLIYSDATPQLFLPFTVQTLIYTLLLAGAGLFDLYRKDL